MTAFDRRSLLVAALLALLARPAAAEEPVQIPQPGPRTEQALEDAWWTGPMLASSAATLSKGRWLVDPYLFDVRGEDGDSMGNLTYILYGVSDEVTVGVIPTFSFNRPDGAPNSSHVGLGDLTLQAQYRLTAFRTGRWVPTTSVVLQGTLPTGKYDRLGGRAADGFGSGAYATTLGFYTQTYAWAPNGARRQCLRHAQRLPRPREAGRVSADGLCDGIQRDPELGRGARPRVSSR